MHNALPFLDEAVRSILAQSHANFEFVIYDDASTDGSTEHLRMWSTRDRRIRLIEGIRNLGPAASSNAVVAQATSRLIARMDADDISHPERLRRQVELLESRRDVGLVGSLSEMIDGSGQVLRGCDWWRLRRRSWFVPFSHGSIMYRRALFDRIGGYREQCEFWEDQDFVLRMSGEAKIVTIPLPLYQHRHSQVSTRLASDRDRVEHAVDLAYRPTDQLSSGHDYENLLQARAARPTKVDPRVFISLGSLTLWAGGRPRMFRRLLDRGALKLNLPTMTALLWTAWTSLSPASFRAFVSALSKLRNRVARKGLEGVAVEWVHPIGPTLSSKSGDAAPAATRPRPMSPIEHSSRAPISGSK